MTLARDAFGLYKILVVVTSTGKAFGIHTANGAVVWSRVLGLDVGRVVGEFRVRVGEKLEQGGAPSVIVVANYAEGEVGISSFSLESKEARK